MLGLMSSSDLEATYSEKSIRSIFWKYPQGKAIFTYLLSLMESDETDKPKFGWWEQAHEHAESTTLTSGSLGGGGAGPFTNSALTVSAAAAGWTFTAGTSYGVFVTDASKFRVDDVVWFKRVPNAAANAFLELKGTVTALDTTANTLVIRALATVASVTNDTDGNGLTLMVIGKASAENDRSRQGGYKFPVEIENYTQIFRETIGPFSRNSLKEGQRFDKSGVYESAVKQGALRVTEAMEMACFFSHRSVATVTNQNGQSTPNRTMGGILWFLEQYEKGDIGNGGIFDYRLGGDDITSSSWATEELKRVIKINGAVTCDQLEMLARRAFDNTADSGFEKIMLCGPTLYNVFQKYFKLNSYKTTTLRTKEESYGMNITEWESPSGILYLKSHPLFQRTSLRSSGFVIDMGCTGWTDFQDSELTLLKNRQNNDDDGRKDEYLGEGGLVLKAPENHMYLEGITDVTV